MIQKNKDLKDFLGVVDKEYCLTLEDFGFPHIKVYEKVSFLLDQAGKKDDEIMLSKLIARKHLKLWQEEQESCEENPIPINEFSIHKHKYCIEDEKEVVAVIDDEKDLMRFLKSLKNG